MSLNSVYMLKWCERVVVSNMYRYNIFILLLKLTRSSHADCYNHYGSLCEFVPAPSGKVPPCARPGQTFCENPEGYPGDLIMFLTKLARYNPRELVVDETKDEYSATTGPYPPAKYPLFYKDIDITTPQPHQNFYTQWQNGGLIPTHTNNAANFTGNSFDTFGGYQDADSQHGVQYLRDINKFTRLHERVKRSELLKRHMRQIRESEFKKNFKGEVKFKRTKRQNDDLNSEELCRTRSSFIMPRAALNKNGVWMYIVNMENENQKYTQLVRSEVCVSQTCSSLCGLPNGYTSRCEQKYIQKRLIALQGQGDQLYTDVFWIPSCCVCTIQRN